MIIAEALLLLALDDETGKPDLMVDPPESRLADAVLVELALLGRIAPPAGAADAAAPLALLDPTPTGHPELDAALAVVGAGAVSSAGAGTRLTPGLRDRLLQGLADRGVLHAGDRRLLGAPRRRTADPAPEAALRERLRTVLLDGADPDPRDVALLAMAGPWLASRLVPDDRLREAEGRVEEIAATFRSAPDAAAGGSAALVSAILLTTIVNPLI